eukprot:m.243343 g.243343  ORF g.243343 m.243343 type:complete len:54 (+) comp15341_c0_seq6:249-410(+)
MRVKGEIEEAVKAMAFQSLDIFRPGMLGRGEAARPVEKFFGKDKKPWLMTIKA